VSARVLFATGVALLAISAPAAKACNITAEVDHAARMTQAEPQRAALSAKQQTTKAQKTTRTGSQGSRYADYPR